MREVKAKVRNVGVRLRLSGVGWSVVAGNVQQSHSLITWETFWPVRVKWKEH